MVRIRKGKGLMAGLLGLGMDAVAGGVFGIAGTALGRVAGFFERKQTDWFSIYFLTISSGAPPQEATK